MVIIQCLGIFILCAFRDSEIDEDHPLLAMLQYMRDLSVRVVDLHLEPLSQESVRRIIGDTLLRDPDSKRVREDPEMQTLVELVYAKTQGNPFFVVQLLKSLYRGGHIVFDFRVNQWRFNLTSIEASDLPPTVVDLLVKQMLKLSDETRTAMMLASCIGTERISLQTLATAAGKRVEETAGDLWGALDAGLILPTGGNYKIHLALEGSEMTRSDGSSSPKLAEDRPRTAGLGISNPDDEDATYRFSHDRVRQAAHSLIPLGERAGLHRMIGMRMLAKATEEDLNEGVVYEIVNQLNHFTTPLEADERRVLMELNLRAGKKALQATAFATALNYFQIAKRVLSDAEKQDDAGCYTSLKRLSFGFGNSVPFVVNNETAIMKSPAIYDRTLEELGTEINISLMEGYFADIKYSESIQLAEEILPMCTESKDKVRCLINKMNCLLVQGKLNEAIEAGLTGLGILSWEVPLKDEEAEKHAQMIRPRILLEIKQIKAIARMHEMKDANLLLLQEIISTLLLPIYMSRPSLLPAVCYTSVAITLEFGVSMAGAYPLLMTGVILGSEGTHDNLARSYAYGQLAIRLIENSKTRHPLAPAIYQVYAGHIGVFHQSMNEVLRCLQQAVQTGISVFNVDYTTFAMASVERDLFYLSLANSFFPSQVELTSFGMMSGENLSSVQSKMVAAKPNIKRFKQETGMWWLNLPMQFLLNLRGQGNPDPLCFEGEALGNSKDLARLAGSESLSHIYMYHMWRLIIAAMYGYWELTADLAVHCCRPLSSAMTGTFYAGLTAFYSSVALLTLHKKLSGDQRDLLSQNISSIKEWGTRARATWLHKSVFLEAEMMRISDSTQQLQILDLYDHAIALSNKSGFVHDSAFINERCGTWLHDISRKRATPYLQESYRCYSSWGATHKAAELRKQFSEELLLVRGRYSLWD
jgi:osomolarity two-component system sensor histidine kinase CHK1